MINKITLNDFKCFSKLNLELSNLNLLSGQNSSGKSSTIQSLLLLQQSYLASPGSATVLLNGLSVSLGSIQDVVNNTTGKNAFQVELEWNGEHYSFYIQGDGKDSLTGVISNYQLPWDEALDDLMQKMLYVSTERIGPRDTYAADYSDANMMQLGKHGEYSPWYLHRNRDREIYEDLRIEGVPPQLMRQCEEWMREFFPNVRLEVEPVKGAQLVTLKFRTSDGNRFHRPENVGYGFTYLLPIIVGGLGAKKGSVFIVENPESHLHPSAQTKVGRFLAKVAASGVQVIIESHSDHVLNGIRLSVKDGVLLPEQAKFHFFQAEDYGHRVMTPRINEDGQIEFWPKGFFDQFETDLDQLTTW